MRRQRLGDLHLVMAHAVEITGIEQRHARVHPFMDRGTTQTKFNPAPHHKC